MTRQDSRPLVGISVGDPGGVGPEITAKALASSELYAACRPLVIADAGLMQEAIRIAEVPLLSREIRRPAEGEYRYGVIDVLGISNVDLGKLRYGSVDPLQGKACYQYIETAIRLAQSRAIDATVTGPIHKEALHAAGYPYAGHTEIFAELTGTRDYAMMLADGEFRVVHVSTHVSLRQAIDRVKKPRVLAVIGLAFEALKKLGVESPRIAVSGLNPHAGEGGLFGREEIDEIAPAVQQARLKGIDVEGPLPPDTVFSKMRGGMYDIVVVMYHDQGHIPTKLVGFHYDQTSKTWRSMAGVNVTLGLPIVRTSVDHGVAFGKAGKGRANPQSMIEAIRMAVRLCG